MRKEKKEEEKERKGEEKRKAGKKGKGKEDGRGDKERRREERRGTERQPHLGSLTLQACWFGCFSSAALFSLGSSALQWSLKPNSTSFKVVFSLC